MFVVATKKTMNLAEVERYLYAGQHFYTGTLDTDLGQAVIIESCDQNLAQQLVDRLGSGWFGARDFPTLDEARAYIEDELGLP